MDLEALSGFGGFGGFSSSGFEDIFESVLVDFLVEQAVTQQDKHVLSFRVCYISRNNRYSWRFWIYN